MTVGLRIVTFSCLCVGVALLVLDALAPAPLLALAGPVPVDRTLMLIAGLFFCTAVSTAAAALLLQERQTATDPELAPE
jgi:hypothetical protein